MQEHHLDILKAQLLADFVPHLPPLEPNSRPPEQNARKNLSRALSAWAISKRLGVPPAEAGQSVIDDFNDCGIDAR